MIITDVSLFEIAEQYKFVKFTDGTYIWSKLDYFSPSHRNMAEQYPDKKPQAAGLINFKGKSWNMTDSYSTSLRLGCDETVYDEISKMLGKPNEYE